jgi:hypothetical protein
MQAVGMVPEERDPDALKRGTEARKLIVDPRP